MRKMDLPALEVMAERAMAKTMIQNKNFFKDGRDYPFVG